MSLVGPRPERPELIEQFKEEIPHYNARHNIKPGITGWAQVNGLRGDTDLSERVRFDLHYIENWNVLLDFQIMFLTFVKREGRAEAAADESRVTGSKTREHLRLNWFRQALANDQAEIDAPPAPSLTWFRWLFAGFLFSFVFDYKSPELEFGAVSTGGSVFQFAFLGLAMATGGLATLLGWKHLLVRPGVYSVILWWGYVVMALTVAFLWGNETGRILRLAIPLLLVGFGLNATLIVAACGMRAGEAVRWFLGAAMTNVLWRFVFGATMTNTPLSEIRMEILSPAIGFLFAWTGCAFLLRHRFTWWSLVILGVPLAVAPSR